MGYGEWRSDIPLVEAGVMHVRLGAAGEDLVDFGTDRPDVDDLDPVRMALLPQAGIQDGHDIGEHRRRASTRGHDAHRPISRQ
jgi:hypothetical protein